MQSLTASWGAWRTVYGQCYAALPDRAADAKCPNCGSDELRLAFTGQPEQRRGYASFWCDGCLVGIHLSRCPVPDGVPMESLDTPVGQRAVRVPDYTLLWPDEDE